MNQRNLLISVIGGATLLFLVLPVLIMVPMSFSAASSLTFPPTGLSWRWYSAFFESPAWRDALRNSIVLAGISSTLALALGSLAAYGVARRQFRFKAAIESNFMAPMILPSIITAVALYIGFAKVGLLGTFNGLLLAHTVLSVPFVVAVMIVAIRAFDMRLEQVAWTMGASWFFTARKVLIPQLLPNLAAAWILSFVNSFDEVVVTSFIAGSYETIPKRMFGELILEITPTITAVATLLIATTVVGLGLVALLLSRSNSVNALTR